MALTYQFVSQTTGHLFFDPGQTRSVQIVVKNTSGFTWSKTGSNPVRLGTTNAHDRASGFYKSGNAGWLNDHRIEMVESTVPNNSNATFIFEVTNGVNTRGCLIYREYFDLVQEGVGWFSPDNTLSLDFDCRAISIWYYPWMTKDYSGGTDYYRRGHHWGSTVSAENNTTDIPKPSAVAGGTYAPADGYYDSGDPESINRHVELISNAGVNNICVAYSGHGSLTAQNLNKLITELYYNWPNMTFTIFMDNMNAINSSEYAVIQWYNSHPNIRVYDSKALLLTFGNITPTDTTNFTQVSCGANDSTTGWIFGNTTLSPVRGACGAVVPRVDDRALGSASGQPFYRAATQTYDPNLSDDAHGIQFATVKSAWQSSTLNNTRIVFFATWNEYHERVGPYEPHVDKNINGVTSPTRSDTYLYDKLVNACGQLRA